jgi:hypothetical protein
VGRSGFDIGYGDCSTYATGQSNNQYCSTDGALEECSECGLCVDSGSVKTARTAIKTPMKQAMRPTPRTALAPSMPQRRHGATLIELNATIAQLDLLLPTLEVNDLRVPQVAGG